MPKISVILTSFNHEKFIRESIDSVLGQTFTDFELFIWDDASVDGSWEIINSYSDPRIKAFCNEVTKRGIYGYNKTISELASGEYIAIHHSDDVWELDKLEKQVAYLDAHPEIGAVFTWVQIIDEHGIQTTDDWFIQENQTRWGWLNQLFHEQNHLNHPSVLIRKQCYQDVGVYRYGLAQACDAEMWSRVLLKFPIHIIQEKLTRHRLFSDKSNTSGRRAEVVIRVSNEWNVLRENYLAIAYFEDIVATFPNLERFRSQEGCDNKFVLAMACLYECKQRSAWQLGLKWLFELLNDKTRYERIRRLYSFSYLDFIRLTAEFDVYFAERDEQIARLKAERDRQIAERDGQIGQRDARIHQIVSSRSWRLTRPLRVLARHIRAPKLILEWFQARPHVMSVPSDVHQGVGTVSSKKTVSAAIETLKATSFAEIQRAGYHFQANDFYSPLNDVEFLKDNLDLWKQRPSPSSIHWNPEGQLAIARKVGLYVEELRDVPQDQHPGELKYCWNNPMWNNADALVHYGLLRDLKPKQVVEIGCGWSSLLMQRALVRNQAPCRVTQIEPYPNPALFKLFPKEWQLLRTPLQRAPFEVFESLRAGDICFYDGSHCAKVASDVNWFFFEILPRLAPGVIIHIHDIFLPDDYPDLWIFERGQTWNEQYLLQAFLMSNSDYKVLMANAFLYKTNAKALQELYRGIQPPYGCSFWMQKVR
jgi:glycosyltransferase involved in cell wall biosynthesis